MDLPGELDPKRQFRFAWTDEGTEDPGKGTIVHLSFRRTCLKTRQSRDFKLGDVITVKSDTGGVDWVAHLVALFEFDGIKSDQDMRCTLRWFYRPSDFEARVLIEHGQVTSARADEVYFSDLLEMAGSNHVSVIHGLAFLFEMMEERRALNRSPPERFQKGDLMLYMSCFAYNPQKYKTASIRSLDAGELRRLLENPNPTDDDLFSKNRPRMQAARGGSARKSTGPKMRKPLPIANRAAGAEAKAVKLRPTARKSAAKRSGSALKRAPAPAAPARAQQMRGRKVPPAADDDADDVVEEASQSSSDDGSNFSDCEPDVARRAKSGALRRRRALRNGKAGSKPKVARTAKNASAGSGRGGRNLVVIDDSDESDGAAHEKQATDDKKSIEKDETDMDEAENGPIDLSLHARRSWPHKGKRAARPRSEPAKINFL